MVQNDTVNHEMSKTDVRFVWALFFAFLRCFFLLVFPTPVTFLFLFSLEFFSLSVRLICFFFAWAPAFVLAMILNLRENKSRNSSRIFFSAKNALN